MQGRVAIILASAVLGLGAQQVGDPLAELLATKVEVASRTAQTLRTSPGVITLLTREEIVASGARDLLEVLRFVPGFEGAADVQGVVSLGFRGHWGTEGKILLLVDGQEQNELRYGNLFLGNNLPTDLIQRIEVVRGPGSAVHGGFAELAVVNVITRGAELGGTTAAATLSRSREGFTRRNLSLGYGNRRGELTYSLTAFRGLGNRGDRPFEVDATTVVPQAGQAYLNDTQINFGLQYRGLSLRLLEDRYHQADVTGGWAPGLVLEEQFNQRAFELKYDWEAAPGLRLVPRLALRESQGWFYPSLADTRDREVDRSTAGLTATWEPTGAWSLVAGAEGFRDEGLSRGSRKWVDGSSRLTFRNLAAHAQVIWTGEVGSLTLGSRFERHSQAGQSFVPRLAFTRVAGDTHLKVLAAQAFRAPVVENLNLNPAVRPERTTTLEVEVGHQFSPGAFASVNLFDITVKDSITFLAGVASPTRFSIYYNWPRTRTRGLEGTLSLLGEFGSLSATVSTYRATENRVPDYQVDPDPSYLLGLPRLKGTLLASVPLGERLSLAPSLVAIGPRYGFGPGDTAPRRFGSVTVANALLHLRIPRFDLRLSGGVLNLTDARQDYLGAYSSAGSPIPGASREFMVRLGYDF